MTASASRTTAHRAKEVFSPDLSLTEWAVLGILASQPVHGFAVARELDREASVGRVWRIPRALVYRALARLEEQALIRPHATEAGEGGPQRTIYRIERRGRMALERWLRIPVEHLRDVRTELLLKLVLCERHGVDPGPLVRDQQSVFAPLLTALALPASGPIDPVMRWRHESSRAVARFLDGLLADLPPPTSRVDHPHAATPRFRRNP